MPSKVSLTYLDASGELSTVEYYIPDTIAGNIAAQLDDSLPQTALSTAALISSMSLCTPVASKLIANDDKFTRTQPGSLLAQREIGLMVSYSDNVTGKLYRITIPGADWANLGQPGTDQVDATAAGWVAFKAKFETEARSPVGNAITVTGGRLVGRSR